MLTPASFHPDSLWDAFAFGEPQTASLDEPVLAAMKPFVLKAPETLADLLNCTATLQTIFAARALVTDMLLANDWPGVIAHALAAAGYGDTAALDQDIETRLTRIGVASRRLGVEPMVEGCFTSAIGMSATKAVRDVMQWDVRVRFDGNGFTIGELLEVQPAVLLYFEPRPPANP